MAAYLRASPMLKPEDHFDQLLYLLDLELQADREKFREEIQRLPLQERIRKGYTWWPLTVVETGNMLGDRAYVILERPAGKQRDSSIKSGSPVRYYTAHPGVERPELSAVVHWIKDRQIMIALSVRQLPAWTELSQQGLDLEFDENTYKEMRLALEKSRHSKGRLRELSYILTGNQAPVLKGDPGLLRDDLAADPVTAQLNSSQREAIAQAECAEDVSLIHGPPGTGKTTTLVALIQRLLRKESQLLVCAPSNVAVDLLAERCAEKGLRVVRTGHISRVNEELLSLTLDAQVAEHSEYKQIKRIKVEASELRRQAIKLSQSRRRHESSERGHLFRQAGELDGWARQLERRILSEVLDGADVICCTLTGANAEFLRDRAFGTVLIDEAAQALEPAVWIGLQRARRLIMAGDPFQLPPTVKSAKAAREGLAETMMERLLQTYPGCANLLEMQYRMHHTIMGFSNAYFYGGRLKSAQDVEHRKLSLPDEPALRFIDTAGTGFAESVHAESLSRYNSDEFLLLTTYLYSFRDRFAESEWPSIALISPYREQVERMRMELATDPLLSTLDVVVHTIDGFQGQERDWVLISLVRSNDRQELGFLKDYRRINVAMTRARMQLVLIGDSATIGADPFFGALLDYVEAHGEYSSAFAYMHS